MRSLAAKIWRALQLSTGFQLKIMRLIQDQFLIGVTGIIFDSDKKVLLVKHSYRSDWSLPGGYIKKGEHPKEALEREIFEETGLTVAADERLKIRTDRNSPRLDITYKGTLIGGKFTPSREVSDADFFSFDTLPLIPRDQLLFINQARKSG